MIIDANQSIIIDYYMHNINEKYRYLYKQINSYRK